MATRLGSSWPAQHCLPHFLSHMQFCYQRSIFQSSSCCWHWDFAVSQFSSACSQSSIVVLGGLMQGVQNQHFAGSVLDVVHPLAVISPRSPIRLCRTGRRMAQTEIKSVTANFCKSLHPCFGAVFCHPVRHSLYLCGQKSSPASTPSGPHMESLLHAFRLVCHCLGHFDDDDRES